MLALSCEVQETWRETVGFFGDGVAREDRTTTFLFSVSDSTFVIQLIIIGSRDMLFSMSAHSVPVAA